MRILLVKLFSVFLVLIGSVFYLRLPIFAQEISVPRIASISPSYVLTPGEETIFTLLGENLLSLNTPIINHMLNFDGDYRNFSFFRRSDTRIISWDNRQIVFRYTPSSQGTEPSRCQSYSLSVRVAVGNSESTPFRITVGPSPIISRIDPDIMGRDQSRVMISGNYFLPFGKVYFRELGGNNTWIYSLDLRENGQSILILYSEGVGHCRQIMFVNPIREYARGQGNLFEVWVESPGPVFSNRVTFTLNDSGNPTITPTVTSTPTSTPSVTLTPTVTVSVSPTATQTPAGLPGDFNNNGAIEQGEIDRLSNCYNPFNTVVSTCRETDLNRDSLVNALDYSIILTSARR